MKNLLILGAVAVILCSCSSSKKLVKNLSRYTFPLEYQYDSDISICERKAKVAIGAVRVDSFDVLTNVSKTKTSVYPFLFYNSITEDYWVRLGQNSLEQSYSDFFVDSFWGESKRTGCYTVVDNPKDADYVIDFIFKDNKTEAKYRMNSQILFFIFYYVTVTQEPGSFSTFTNMDVQVRLSGRSGRFEKSYTLEKEMSRQRNFSPNMDDLQFDFMANMAKSLSMTTKECVEMIIRDINLNVKYKPEE